MGIWVACTLAFRNNASMDILLEVFMWTCFSVSFLQSCALSLLAGCLRVNPAAWDCYLRKVCLQGWPLAWELEFQEWSHHYLIDVGTYCAYTICTNNMVCIEHLLSFWKSVIVSKLRVPMGLTPMKTLDSWAQVNFSGRQYSLLEKLSTCNSTGRELLEACT